MPLRCRCVCPCELAHARPYCSNLTHMFSLSFRVMQARAQARAASATMQQEPTNSRHTQEATVGGDAYCTLNLLGRGAGERCAGVSRTLTSTLQYYASPVTISTSPAASPRSKTDTAAGSGEGNVKNQWQAVPLFVSKPPPLQQGMQDQDSEEGECEELQGAGSVASHQQLHKSAASREWSSCAPEYVGQSNEAETAAVAPGDGSLSINKYVSFLFFCNVRHVFIYNFSLSSIRSIHMMM